MIKIDKAKCNGCKNCIEICPVETAECAWFHVKKKL